jgi:anti-sigma regulatory factor (Ser/Thr protein kinase)
MAVPYLANRVPIERLMRLHTDSSPESLTAARQQIRRAAQLTRLTKKGVAELEMAAGELLSNVHRHAYANEAGPLFIEVFHTPRMITLIVIDRGSAVATPALPSVLPPRDSVTGRGLYLVSRLSDEVMMAVNPIGHGLAIRISKWFEDVSQVLHDYARTPTRRRQDPPTRLM